MLNLIKQLFSPKEKALLNCLIQGRVSADTARHIERMLRGNNLSGSMRVINNAMVEISVEGAKSALDQIVLELPHLPAMSGMVMKVSWGEYKGRFQGLRISL